MSRREPRGALPDRLGRKGRSGEARLHQPGALLRRQRQTQPKVCPGHARRNLRGGGGDQEVHVRLQDPGTGAEPSQERPASDLRHRREGWTEAEGSAGVGSRLPKFHRGARARCQAGVRER